MAALAAACADCHVRLEQGREVNPSPAVLARALLLMRKSAHTCTCSPASRRTLAAALHVVGIGCYG